MLGFPDASQVRLEENFRSTGHILAAANAVISCDAGRLGKTLFTSEGMGEPVDVVSCRGPGEEASGIAAEMVRRNAGGVPWGSMALLYRGNALARSYEEALSGDMQNRSFHILGAGLARSLPARG